MVIARAGHSLPELIVTVAFLGAAVGGVGASSVLGARWALDGLRRQNATHRAAALLDSLVNAPEPGSGTRSGAGWEARWEAGPRGRVRVRVLSSAGTELARLEGRRVPRLPTLPDMPVDTLSPHRVGPGAP